LKIERLTARFARGIPPSGSPHLTAAQSPKKLKYFLTSIRIFFNLIKESIFAGFDYLLTQGRAASYPKPRFARLTIGQKFLSSLTP
jgi:hypothetical protein